jgi:hypothetical protein
MPTRDFSTLKTHLLVTLNLTFSMDYNNGLHQAECTTKQQQQIPDFEITLNNNTYTIVRDSYVTMENG